MSVEAARTNAVSQQKGRGSRTREVWRAFADCCTLHGLRYTLIGDRSSTFRRCVWVVLLVSGFVYFCFEGSILVANYFSYSVTTRVSLEFEHSSVFPAVTICNMNTLRRSALTPNALNIVQQFFSRSVGEYVNKTKVRDWSSFNHTIKSADMREQYRKKGHLLKDMVIECTWQGKPCRPEDFTETFTGLGLCYTFNSGKIETRKWTSYPGVHFGLTMKLDVQRSEYTTAESVGVKVQVHDQDTVTMVNELGFSMAPGTANFLAVRKEQMLSLPAPYESRCIHNSRQYYIPGYDKYSSLSCHLYCISTYIIDKCGCTAHYLPDIGGSRICNNEDDSACVLKIFGNFRPEDSLCECPRPCDFLSYVARLSYASFPSLVFLKAYARLKGIDSDNMTKMDELETYARANFLELNVYYQELSYLRVKEEPAYTIQNCFGEVGGLVGLCLGASLLTVVEFLDVIIRLLCINFGLT